MATCHCHRDPLATCPNSLQPLPEVNPVTSLNLQSRMLSARSVSLLHKILDILQLSHPIQTGLWMYFFFTVISVQSLYQWVCCFSLCEALCFLPTSLWLPPVFSSCRFSPAGMSYFSHSWRGPSSELSGRCRLSAHSPQHIGKNGEFLPLWSSSFFKCFPQHSDEDIKKCQ